MTLYWDTPSFPSDSSQGKCQRWAMKIWWCQTVRSLRRKLTPHLQQQRALMGHPRESHSSTLTAKTSPRKPMSASTSQKVSCRVFHSPSVYVSVFWMLTYLIVDVNVFLRRASQPFIFLGLKNVEVLLQKMFEKELSVHDLGPNIESLDHDLEDEQRYLTGQSRTLWSL